MAHVVADRVLDSTSTVGTSPFVLAAPSLTGYQSIGDVCADGDTIWYTTAHRLLDQWEVGKGTYGAGTNVLTRTIILASSNAGSAVNFSAGMKDVVSGVPASRFGLLDSPSGLPTLSLADDTADYVQVYDTSAGQWAKVLQSNLGFTQSGGGQLRAIQGRLRDTVHVADFPGFDNSGVANQAAVFEAAKDALPAAGGRLVVQPGTYLDPNIVLDKSVHLDCSGKDATVFKSTSATAPVITLSVENCRASGFTIDHTIVRTTGNSSIEVTVGGGSRVDQYEINAPAIGIRVVGAFDFFWTDHGYIRDIPAGYGVGVGCYGNSGIYADSIFMLGHNLDLVSQPFAGFDLSNCGNGIITNSQTLACGSGLRLSPTAGIATSIDVATTYFDNCQVSVDMQPSGTGAVSTVKLTSVWMSAAHGQGGLVMKPGAGGIVTDITAVNCTVYGCDPGPGITIGGGAGITKNIRIGNIAGYSNKTCLLDIGDNVYDVTVNGSTLGDSSFPNDKTVNLHDNCNNVVFSGNSFCDNIATKVTNTSTGSGISFARDNVGYQPDLAVSTQITANQDNYAPNNTTSLLDATLQINSDAARIITGLAGGTVGARRIFQNAGSFPITFQTGSGSSLAANQFNMPAHMVLEPGGTIAFFYDSSASRWKIIGQPAGADLAGLEALSGTGFAVRSATTPTWVQRTFADAAAGVGWSNGDGIAGNPTLVLANDLAALEALGSTGLAVRTATDTWAQRTLTAPAAGFSITNPAGVAGNPTFVLANDLAALEGLGATGFAARTTTDTWAQRTLQAPAAGLSISNPAGIAGDPTFALTNDLAAVEGLGGTGVIRRTGTDTWSAGTLVSYAEIQNIATTQRILARKTADAGTIEECTIQEVLDFGVPAINSGAFSGFRNILINQNCSISQRNKTVATTTADNAYWADRWRYIGEASASCTAQDTVLGGSNNAYKHGGAIKFTGTTDKGGAFQVVEGINARHLSGRAVTASAVISVSNTRLGNIKMGIVEWTGTEDATTGDPVSSWGADGVTPTLNASWAFLNTPANLSVTTSPVRYSVTGTCGASMKNLALLIWNDDKSYTANDTMYFTEAQIIPGSTAPTYAEHRPLDVDLASCQRYFQSFGGESVAQRIGGGFWATTTDFYAIITHIVAMRTAPSAIGVSAAADWQGFDGAGFFAASAVTFDSGGTLLSTVKMVTAAATAFRTGQMLSNFTGNSRVTFDVEI